MRSLSNLQLAQRVHIACFGGEGLVKDFSKGLWDFSLFEHLCDTFEGLVRESGRLDWATFTLNPRLWTNDLPEDYLLKPCVAWVLTGLIQIGGIFRAAKALKIPVETFRDKFFCLSVGHSSGSILAAAFALDADVKTAMTWAIKVLFWIGVEHQRVLEEESIDGGMIHVRDISADEIEANYDDVAVVNGNSVVLSGTHEKLKHFEALFKGRKVKRLPVSFPYHSWASSKVFDGLLKRVQDLAPPSEKLRVPLYSCSSGEQLKHAWFAEVLADVTYRKVRWDKVIQKLQKLGTKKCVDFGPGGSHGVGLITKLGDPDTQIFCAHLDVDERSMLCILRLRDGSKSSKRLTKNLSLTRVFYKKKDEKINEEQSSEVALEKRLWDVLNSDRPLAATVSFFDQGLTSSGLVKLASSLSETLKKPVSIGDVFACQNPKALVEFLLGRSTAPLVLRTKSVLSDRKVKVCGLSGIFPGNIQLSRIIGEEHQLDHDHSRLEELGNGFFGYFIPPDVIQSFDGKFFGIADREAQFMDPQQRLLLQESWHAWEDSSMNSGQFSPESVSCFVGIWNNDSVNKMDDTSHYYALGNTLSAAAGRISYFYGFQGPSATIDTACSSSLVASIMGLKSIQEGSSEVSVVGSANLLLGKSVFSSFLAAGMLSPKGHCKTFDQEADGYVRSEAIICTIIADKNAAPSGVGRANVLGGSFNHNGRSNGITAPNPRAQAQVIQISQSNSGVSSDEVNCIQAHGTGTPLGDPIEVHGMSLTQGKRSRALVVEALKSYVGHSESSAGLSGVAAAILSLEQGKMFKNMHFCTLNRNISTVLLEMSKMVLPLERMESEQAKTIGVSSFGFTGMNSHLILRSDPKERLESQPKIERVAIISCADENMLEKSIEMFMEGLKVFGASFLAQAYAAAGSLFTFPARAAVTSKGNVHQCQVVTKKDFHKFALFFGDSISLVSKTHEKKLTKVSRLAVSSLVSMVEVAEDLVRWGCQIDFSGGIGIGALALAVYQKKLRLDDAISMFDGSYQTYGLKKIRRAFNSSNEQRLVGEISKLHFLFEESLSSSSRSILFSSLNVPLKGQKFVEIPKVENLKIGEASGLVSYADIVNAARHQSVLTVCIGGGENLKCAAKSQRVESFVHVAIRRKNKTFFNSISEVVAKAFVSGTEIKANAIEQAFQSIPWMRYPFSKVTETECKFLYKMQWKEIDGKVREKFDIGKILLCKNLKSHFKAPEHRSKKTLGAFLTCTRKSEEKEVMRAALFLKKCQTLTITKILFFSVKGVKVLPSELDISKASAAIWGFARTAISEYSDNQIIIADIESSHDLFMPGNDLPSEIAIRKSRAFQSKLEVFRSLLPKNLKIVGSTVIVLGGWGGLGSFVTNWLCEKGAEGLCIVGRNGPEKSKKDLLGRNIKWIQSLRGDASDFGAAKAIISKLLTNSSLMLFHLAGVNQAALIKDVTIAQVKAVFRAKVTAMSNLDSFLNKTIPKVLFSSISSVIGISGSCIYAAANAALETFALHGGDNVAIGWGPISGAGMYEIMNQSTKEEVSSKVQPLPATLLPILVEKAWLSGESVVFVAKLSEKSKKSQNRVELHSFDLLSAISSLCNVSKEEIDRNQPLQKLGFDSFMCIELAREIETVTGLRVAATIAYDYPTPFLLEQRLKTLKRGDEIAKVEIQERKIHTAEVKSEIGVYGAGWRFSDCKSSWERMWQILRCGQDCVATNNRWKSDKEEKAGLVSDIDLFDASFFGISKREAQVLDPQHRMLLECAWESIEDAGESPSEISEDTGVYVGIQLSEYDALIKASGVSESPYSATGSALSTVSGRLSYFLNLTGLTLSIDTACSSSLVCIETACKEMTLSAKASLCAGVNAILDQTMTEKLRQAGMLAPDGRCKTFDRRANGYVRAEGCGVVYLKRKKEEEEEDGERVTVLGHAVNQDGRSNGLTAPNGPSQVRLLREAMERAQAGAEGGRRRRLQVLEAHGTGTSLGDPIEVQAVAEAQERDKATPLVIGSAKTNFGHAETAAGVLGVLKMVLCMERRTVARHLHMQELNEYIGTGTMEGMRGVVGVEETEWGKRGGGGELVCGVSSFGFSGTNAHVVLFRTQFAVQAEHHTFAKNVALVITCQSADALSLMVKKVKSCLVERVATDVQSLCDMFSSKSPLKERVALIGKSKKELVNCEGSSLISLHAPKGHYAERKTSQLTYAFCREKFFVAQSRSTLNFQKKLDVSLHQIIQEEFGIEDIKQSDELMSLGLDSMSSALFVSSLKTNFGVQIPSTWLHDFKTIGELEEFVMKNSNETISQKSFEKEQVLGALSGILGADERVEESSRFVDLGIDSISAAELRAKISQTFGVEISAAFMQEYETIGDLLSKIEDQQRIATPTSPKEEAVHVPSLPLGIVARNTTLRFMVQTLLVTILLCLFWACVFTGTIVAYYGISIHPVLIVLCFPAGGISLWMYVVPFKWIAIGRYREGIYPIWGWYFIRWWLVRRAFSMVFFLVGIFLTEGCAGKFWYFSQGCKIAWRSHLRAKIFESDLVQVDCDAGTESDLSAAFLYPTCLVLKKVHLEEGSWVGLRSVIKPGCTLPKKCKLEDLSYLDSTPTGAEEGRILKGSPARFVEGTFSPNSTPKNIFLEITKLLIQLGTRVAYLSLSVWPAVFFFNFIWELYSIYWALGSLMLLIPLLVTNAVFLQIVFKWLIVWRLCPGRYKIDGFVDFRRDLYNNIIEGEGAMFRSHLNYLPWMTLALRLTGARISRQTIFGVPYSRTDWDLVKAGRSCFIGPAVTLKTFRYEGSQLILSEINIGNDCSIGTGSILQAGSQLRDCCQVSSLSLVEEGSNLTGGTYSGVPLRLTSSVTSNMQKNVKYFPIADYFVTPLFHVLLHALNALIATAGYEVYVSFKQAVPSSLIPFIELAYLSTGIVFGIMIYLAAFPIVGGLLKQLFLRRSNFVPRVNWSLSLLNLLEIYMMFLHRTFLAGTSVYAAAHYLWGARFEKSVYIDSEFFSDYHILDIGEYSIIEGLIDPHAPPKNGGWGMEFGSVKVGRECIVRRNAIVSVEIEAGDKCVLEPCTRVLIGDRLKSGSIMAGSPAKLLGIDARLAQMISVENRAGIDPVHGQRLQLGTKETMYMKMCLEIPGESRVSIAICFNKRFRPSFLKKAVEILQKSQPFMRGKVVRKGELLFEFDDQIRIPILSHCVGEVDEWKNIWENEISCRPWKLDEVICTIDIVTFKRAKNLSVLMFSCEHAFCDGISVCSVANDLIKLLESKVGDFPNQLLGPPIDLVLNDQYLIEKGRKAVMDLNMNLNFASVTCTKEWSGTFDFFTFSAEEVQDLLKLSRKNSSSITSILSAALCQSIGKLQKRDVNQTAIAVETRRYLSKSLQNRQSLSFQASQAFVESRNNDLFLETAKEHCQTLRHQVENAATLFLATIDNQSFSVGQNVKCANSLLTNWGIFPEQADSVNWIVPLVSSSLCPILLSLTTNGKLTLCVSTKKNSLSSQELLSNIVEKLKDELIRAKVNAKAVLREVVVEF